MKAIALRSVRAHTDWLVSALRPSQNQAAPLTARRAAALIIGVPPYLMLQASHWLGFALDELFFSEYRQVEVRRPLFIVGLPRSGTTFLHRSLARDDKSWSTINLWQAVLAPSITQRRLLNGLMQADQRLGGLGRAFIQHVSKTLMSSFDDIHEIALDAAEEDYLTLMPAAACFLAILAFPNSKSLWQLTLPDTLPAKQREQLAGFYYAMVQKHLYCDERVLLSKNAAFGGWTKMLAERYPDARFIVCIRNPDHGLSSQLSAIRSSQKLLGVNPDHPDIQQRFARMYRDQYNALSEHINVYGERSSVVDMDALRNNAAAEIERLSAHLDFELNDALRAELMAMSTEGHQAVSAHHHAVSCHADAATHRAYQALKATTYPEQKKAC